jgi:hypothetical protein
MTNPQLLGTEFLAWHVPESSKNMAAPSKTRTWEFEMRPQWVSDGIDLVKDKLASSSERAASNPDMAILIRVIFGRSHGRRRATGDIICRFFQVAQGNTGVSNR